MTDLLKAYMNTDDFKQELDDNIRQNESYIAAELNFYNELDKLPQEVQKQLENEAISLENEVRKTAFILGFNAAMKLAMSAK